jgi:hypothetical protein
MPTDPAAKKPGLLFWLVVTLVAAALTYAVVPMLPST